MNLFRRKTVATLVGLFLSAFKMPGVATAIQNQDGVATPDSERERLLAQERRHVENKYSTKTVRVVLGEHRYDVPANYFSPKGADRSDGMRGKEMSFVLFLPEYGGYTKQNWIDQFDKNKIQVLTYEPIDREAENKSSSNRRESQTRFTSLQVLLEPAPTYHEYGLEGYRRVNYKSRKNVYWTGTRTNGEFIFFRSTKPPNPVPDPYRPYPLCEVQYYSRKASAFVAYLYSQNFIAQWREIDAAIWTKIESWGNAGTQADARATWPSTRTGDGNCGISGEEAMRNVVSGNSTLIPPKIEGAGMTDCIAG